MAEVTTNTPREAEVTTNTPREAEVKTNTATNSFTPEMMTINRNVLERKKNEESGVKQTLLTDKIIIATKGSERISIEDLIPDGKEVCFSYSYFADHCILGRCHYTFLSYRKPVFAFEIYQQNDIFKNGNATVFNIVSDDIGLCYPEILEYLVG
ncbi:MAG: hypothetical protein Harvfovirus3_53 [Harvfovirus sp.]|uniref:Uncharacterized protein n=1 Tax=Harvfovirus sp. TaxID=2487768 RepID=A0A3G5A099_9VIRU|nr:MAG: hypothetical protein Harvfovirus3_53 [Harvfovirus sp.]